MNASPSPFPAGPGLTVSLVMACSQLAVAVTGLALAIVHAIQVQMSSYFDGQWDEVPVPLVITGSAIAGVVLISRRHLDGAMMAAFLPAAAHMLPLPFGEWSVWPDAARATFADWACTAAAVVGVAVTVALARAARQQQPRSPAPPGPAAVVMVLSMLALVACWAGEHLSQSQDRAWPVRLAMVALAAAAVAALVDAHTRWAADQGMAAVAAVSAGVSGMVLLVPLGWLLWPLIQQWLEPPQGPHGIGIGITVTTSLPRWEGLSRCLTDLGASLVLAAAATAALTAAHRAATVTLRAGDNTQG